MFERPLLFDIPLGDDALVMPGGPGRPCPGSTIRPTCVLLRFGYGAVRQAEPLRYASHCPGLGVESAQFLRETFPRMRALGMDVPSLSCIKYLDRTMKAHNVLLEGEGRRFWVIEDMHLQQDLDGLTAVIVVPWWISGADGGPATILGRLEPKGQEPHRQGSPGQTRKKGGNR